MIAAAHSTDADAFGGLDSAAPEAPIVYATAERRADGASAGGQEKGNGKGKGKGSRWNAVRHGCMAQELFPASLQSEIDQCTAMLTERYRPTTAFDVAAIAKLGRLAAQLERTQKFQVVDLQRAMDRAVLEWDEDRSFYIDILISKLATDSGVARALARSKQGVDWLLKAWKGLAEVFEFTGRLTDDQKTLALNLLAVRPELQDDYRAIMAEEDAEELTELMTHEIAWLQARLDHSLIALDFAHQSMAAAGMPMEEDGETKRLRKQEARLKLEYRRAKAELIESRADVAAAGPAPATDPAPAPAPTPEPKPEPAPARVVSSRGWIPDEELDPPPRPTTSNAAFHYLEQRSLREAFEVPATETAPAKRVEIQFPFPGGDPRPQPVPESEPESELEPEPEPEPEPVSLVEPAAVRPRPARVASNASREAADRSREKERRTRRALEKKARKAARRNRR